MALVCDVVPEKGDDLGLPLGCAVGRERFGEDRLLLAVVPDADLHDAGHALQVVDDIVHDRGVRPGEALEGGAEVHVRVDLENAHPGVVLGNGLVEPVGDAVLAPDQARDLPLAEGGLRAVVGEPGGAAGVLVHLVDGVLVALLGAPPLDDGLGEDPGLAGPFLDLGGRGLHMDAPFEDVPEAAVEEIDLCGRFPDRYGCVAGSDAVRRGRVVGDGDENDGGVLSGMGEAENVRGVRGGGVWVECHMSKDIGRNPAARSKKGFARSG